MRVPWTARRLNQSILKEISHEYSLERLMLKLKLLYFGHLMQRTGSLEETLILGKIEGKKKRVTDDEMVGWHYQLNGQQFEQAPVDGDCSHKIKRHLLLGRKAITNPDSILKSRDITLLTKVCLVKAMVFPVVMYGCESWTVKKAE